MPDVLAVIRQIATGRGEDPALALATAQVESGFRVDARGDPLPDPRNVGGYCSFGLFQENVCGGAGTGFALADLFDPAGATSRFLDRVQRVRATGIVGPGNIAAAAQRPADPYGYARKVDAIYGGYASGASSPTAGQAPTMTPAPAVDACSHVPEWQKVAIRLTLAQLAIVGITGAEAAARLRANYPDVPVSCLQAIAYGVADVGKGVIPSPDDIGAALSGIPAAIQGATEGALINGAILGTILLLGYAGVRRAVAA